MKIKGYETKTFKELGHNETYVRTVRPNGWEVCRDANGNTFAIRALKDG